MMASHFDAKAAEKSFELQGYVDVRAMRITPEVNERVMFSATFQGCDYVLKTRAGAKEEIIARKGAKSIAIISVPPPPAMSTKSLPPGFESVMKAVDLGDASTPPPRLSVVLDPGVVPRRVGYSAAPVVWFAIGGRCVLKSTGEKLLRFYDMNMLRDPEVLVHYRTYSNSSELIDVADCVSDGTFDIHLKSHWPVPFDKGFTNAIYTLRSARAIGTTIVPERFDLTVFEPEPAQSALVTVASFQAVVTNAQPFQGDLQLPNIPEGEVMAFSDMRFISESSKDVYHYITNRMLSKEEVAETPDYMSKQLTGRIAPKKRSSYPLTSALVIVPFAILLLVMLRKKQTTQTNT